MRISSMLFLSNHLCHGTLLGAHNLRSHFHLPAVASFLGTPKICREASGVIWQVRTRCTFRKHMWREEVAAHRKT